MSQSLSQPDTNNWMDELYVEQPGADAGASAAQPSAAAPAAAPTQHIQPQPEARPAPAAAHATLAPDIEDMLRQQIQRAQNTPPAPAAAPAAPPPIFSEQDITFTPAEQERLAASGAGDLLDKVSRRAIAEYDARVGTNLRREVEGERAQRQALEQQLSEVRADTAARTLQARFPDLDRLRSMPGWDAFANEQIDTPAGRIQRATALGMASQSGNYGYIADQLQSFRQRSGAVEQPAPAPAAAAGFGSLAPAQAVASPAQGGNPVSNPSTRFGGAGSAPAPSLAAINPNRKMSATKVQATLADLSNRVALNPRDEEAKARYKALSDAARTAYFEGNLV